MFILSSRKQQVIIQLIFSSRMTTYAEVGPRAGRANEDDAQEEWENNDTIT